jgi:hypothetical protein
LRERLRHQVELIKLCLIQLLIVILIQVPARFPWLAGSPCFCRFKISSASRPRPA